MPGDWGEDNVMERKVKRIQFVSLLGRSPWGGSEELWSRAAHQLREDGHEVIASVRHWKPAQRHPRVAELERVGVRFRQWGGRLLKYHLLFAQAINPAMRKLGLPPYSPGERFPVERTDLVVFSSGGNTFPSNALMRCRKSGQKYALVAHSVSESTWPRDGEIEEMREAYRQAEAVFFVSNANRESTACQLGFNDPKFRVVVNPFNVDWETPFVWPDEGDETMEWAFVGRLEPGHKGVDLLLRALARKRWKSRNLRVNLYGSGFSEKGLQKTAAYLGLDEKVVFHGQVGDLHGIWKKNRMLVLPSRHEGLPLVVTEAMMFGRACLVTNVSGNPEHLEDGVTGFIGAGPTVDAVDEALERAWESRSRLREMGEAAYVSIRAKIPRDPIRHFTDELIRLA